MGVFYPPVQKRVKQAMCMRIHRQWPNLRNAAISDETWQTKGIVKGPWETLKPSTPARFFPLFFFIYFLFISRQEIKTVRHFYSCQLVSGRCLAAKTWQVDILLLQPHPAPSCWSVCTCARHLLMMIDRGCKDSPPHLSPVQFPKAEAKYSKLCWCPH